MSGPRIHPARLSAADRALFDALDALDPEAMRRALLDGADTEATDMEGCSPLYFLQACSFGHEDSQRLVALCAETLLEAGADAWFFHAVPDSPEAVALCLTREHQCEGCPLDPLSAAGYDCSGNELPEFVHAGMSSDAFAEAFLPWLRRHDENPALLSELRSALAAEREALVLGEGTLPGDTERGPWRGPRP